MDDASGTADHDDTSAQQAAQLAVAVLDAEAERQAQQASAREPVLFADDLLPGVGDEQLTLRQGLATGGIATFVVLLVLTSLDELESATLGVLAPDIRDSLGVSDGVIVFLAGASSAFLVLGALPMGWLADHFKRPPIIGWASVAFGVFVTASGLVVNAFQLFWTRLGVGVAKSSATVHQSMIADTYPIGIRGRIGASMQMGARVVGTLSPVIVAGIATLAGGTDGWRVATWCSASRPRSSPILAFRLREPPRGQFEKMDVLGEVIEDENPAPISVEAAFARLWQIRTIKSVILAFAAIGFGLFTTGVLANLFMEQQYGTKTLERGVLGTIGGFGLLVVLPFAGRYYDSYYRRDPTKALRLVGFLILPAAVLTPVEYFMPNDVPVRDPGYPANDPAVHRVHDGRSLDHDDRPLPVARHGGGTQLHLHLLRGRDRWRADLRADLGRVRAPRRRPVSRDPLDGDRRLPDHPERAVHPQRPVNGGGGAPGGNGGTRTPLGSAGLGSRVAGRQRRLRLRAGPGALRCRVRGSSRRSSRAARHQRRGQVDDSPGRRRPRDAVAGCRTPQRQEHHVHHTRAEGAPRDPHPLGRQGCDARDDGAGEPRDGGVHLPRGSQRGPPSARSGVRPVPSVVGEAQGDGVDAVGWAAADVGARDGAPARSRGVGDRRAVARPRAVAREQLLASSSG